MTLQETKMLMAVIKAAYPNYYRDMGKEELLAVVNLWHDMFRDEPFELVIAATKRLIATDTNGFPPVIGQIKEQLFALQNPKTMPEQEAWSLVRRSIRYYEAKEKFDALPPLLKSLVGSPSTLREWARMDEDTVNSVVASNFMRSYRARAASNKEFSMLPREIQEISTQLAEKLSMPALTDGGKEA